MPQFSVLIPIIKSKFLATAIESVLKQSYTDFELVLYNDCSPDDVESIVRSYSDNRIQYYKGEKNVGLDDPSKTWNKLLSLASGQFVCLLGDDDYLSENYLEEIHKLIQKYPKHDIYRSRLKRVDEKNEVILSGELLPEFETWEQMLFQRNITDRIQSTCEFVLRKNSLLSLGGYVHFPRACGSDDATYLLLAKTNGIVSTNNTYALWRKSLLNISDNDSEEVNKYKIQFLLTWQKEFIDAFFPLKIPAHKLYRSIDTRFDPLKAELNATKAELSSIRTELSSTQSELSSIRSELNAIQSEFSSAQINFAATQAELNVTQSELHKTQGESESNKQELWRIYNSREWKIGVLLQKLTKKIIPKGSFRRIVSGKIWSFIKFMYRQTKKMKTKIRSFILLPVSRTVKSLTEKKKRNINSKSRKIVFIGHSYHAKTKSSEFFINYLKQFFDVELIADESWLGEKPFPDLSFINNAYLAVIFWQNLPDQAILKKIKNENIIYVPMFDAVGTEYDFWTGFKDLKILNFSKTLHDKLSRWGFDEFYIQYFPKPQKFTPGSTQEAFFWQRLAKINIHIISKLFKKGDVSIHLHKAVDPKQEFIEPSEEEKKNFKITFSNWFKTQSEMFDIVKQKGIYVAPRENEGIGLSFLEAMAMGKAVVAIDRPTMNEYIENGKTGYLFKLREPKILDFSNIADVQRNAYNYMQDGFKKWEKNKHKIIKFIKE